MKKILTIVCLALSVAMVSCNGNKDAVSELDIYLLIGQSNMAGRAEIEGEYADTLSGVYLFTDSVGYEWEKAANPLNKYSTIRKSIRMQRMGPGYTFAREMAKANPNKEIGLVVNAKGGTKIELWMPGTHFYNEAVRRTKNAMEYGTLKGIVWHQGESGVTRYKKYTPQIIELIDSLRVEFNNAELPFVAGQLSPDRKTRIPFNEMLLELPSKIEKVGVASSENTTTIDSTHFDAKSQGLLGERYAREMVTLLETE